MVMQRQILWILQLQSKEETCSRQLKIAKKKNDNSLAWDTFRIFALCTHLPLAKSWPRPAKIISGRRPVQPNTTLERHKIGLW